MARNLTACVRGDGSDTARRVVEVNRSSYDSPHPSPGAAEQRIAELEQALAAARSSLAEVTAKLLRLETSTTWRITWPLRRTLELAGLNRTQLPAPAAPPPAPQLPRALTYAEWIVAEEPGVLKRLASDGPGHRAVGQQTLGVVVVAQHGDAAALSALVDICPPDCSILVLDGGSSWQPHGRAAVVPVPAGFTLAEAPALALHHSGADLLCFHDLRDQLAPMALRLMADVLAREPQADILFADEDWLTPDGERVRPWFKGGWDPELQRGRDTLGPFTAMRAGLLRAAAPASGAAWRYDLANQVAAASWPGRIWHIPAVLCHRAVAPPDGAAVMAAAAAQLQRDGVAAQVVAANTGGHRVVYALPEPAPSVSIIVPTRDHAALLAACADGLLNHTDYPRLELLLVDNGTTEPDALALLERLAQDRRVRVLRQPGGFNWSALNNAAAAVATGEILVLLNNDIAVLHPDWLSVLVSHAVQPGVGAVGAMLLYPDGRVQHAGVTTDSTAVPRHLFRFADGAGPGPFGMLGLARTVWGVTGACLAIPRAVFFAVGCLNEALPVAYNDVDLCLRLTANAYRIIWTPWCRLEHRELASRLPDHSPARRDKAREELTRLVRDWGRMVLCDTYLSPNLAILEEQPCFARSIKDDGPVL